MQHWTLDVHHPNLPSLPPPTGYVMPGVCLFVCLSVSLSVSKLYITTTKRIDFHENFTTDVSMVREDLIKF